MPGPGSTPGDVILPGPDGVPVHGWICGGCAAFVPHGMVHLCGMDPADPLTRIATALERIAAFCDRIEGRP